MGGDECISASRGPIGRRPVAVEEIVFIGGLLDHAVQRDVFENSERSHCESPWLRDFIFGRILRNARTSPGTRQATTALRPHASASSMSAASSIQKPPTNSLVSRYGPSVMTTSPPGCLRNDFALAAGSRPPAKNLAPAASISSLSAPYRESSLRLPETGRSCWGVELRPELRHIFLLLHARRRGAIGPF